MFLYISANTESKRGDCGTHGSSHAGDNGAVMKMLSVNPLSTFVTDALEKRKKMYLLRH